MAHHKRRRPKKQRAGCLLCKPHKAKRPASRKADVAAVREGLDALAVREYEPDRFVGRRLSFVEPSARPRPWPRGDPRRRSRV